MKKLVKISAFFSVLSVFVFSQDVCAAARSNNTKKQAALSFGTKVRAKTEAKGIYDQDCYDKYYSCMDQFCIVDNELGGSCNCSDDIVQYESALDDIQKMVAEAERISTEEVEKVKAGANADIIFEGTRKYDEKNNVVLTEATKDKNKAKASMWSSLYESSSGDDDEDDEYDDDYVEISGKTGKALYSAANSLCKREMGDTCKKDMNLLVQMYSRQIVSDCKGLANSIEQKRSEARAALTAASADVRTALRESLEESNKYDRGTCMVEYKKCMKSEDACGADWGQCVFTIASENMQNNEAKSVKGTKVKTITKYDITPSTMEILESKRFICEKVLDSCVAVRQYVWDDFLREAAPTIRVAEQQIESQKRQSCLGDISNCIQKACKDDIEGKGEATMDACLARPEMARSFCKIQLEPCERMEPQIWDYVKSKLAAMRVDVCTQEVKDCFTSEDRCGPDFSNCIGMDFKYIHEICPIDKLVVCKQADPDFNMSKLDDMLMGLYLNVDNKALENCQNLAEEKMAELCGSTTDCNSFAADEYMGTGSIKSQKDGSIYRVTGLISFGSIKVGDASGSIKDKGKALKPGEIGVEDYIKEIRKNADNSKIPNADAIVGNIEAELKNIAGTINRTITLIESDQKIQYCINGRDLSQINGKGKGAKNTTEARFPNLLNQYRTVIAMSALRKAQDNYNKKWQEEVSKATKDASDDLAQYMCQMLPTGTGSMGLSKEDNPVTAPYAISYDVSSGLKNADLLKGGKGETTQFDTAKSSSMNICVACWSGSGVKTEIPGGTKTQWATFNRETRTCRLCTEMVTKNCKQKGVSILFVDTRRLECDPEKREETCDDIPM